ncbi:DNA mismatch repair protein MutS, partial [Calditrichota bacterium]
EMIDLEQYLKGVKNKNIAIREYADKIVFLRKIIPGGSDKSFGIHVAQMAGLPPAVIGRAREVMSNLEENDLSPGEFNGVRSADESEQNLSEQQSVLPKKHVSQLSFFDPGETRLREILETVDPESITPLEALKILSDLKRELNS